MKEKYRIKKAEEFQQIIHKKRSVANSTYVVYYQPKKEEWSRFGLSVGKKQGNAVVRNRCKRQLRMMIQELVDFETHPTDCIVIIRSPFLKQSFEENKKHLETLLNKATIR